MHLSLHPQAREPKTLPTITTHQPPPLKAKARSRAPHHHDKQQKPINRSKVFFPILFPSSAEQQQQASKANLPSTESAPSPAPVTPKLASESFAAKASELSPPVLSSSTRDTKANTEQPLSTLPKTRPYFISPPSLLWTSATLQSRAERTARCFSRFLFLISRR